LDELDVILVEQMSIRNATIFMDNASPHRSLVAGSVMNTLINQTRFMSPYSYMLNQIDNSFSKIKTIVREKLEEGTY
jgi:transposase